MIRDCTKFDRNQTMGGCVIDDLAHFAVRTVNVQGQVIKGQVHSVKTLPGCKSIALF